MWLVSKKNITLELAIDALRNAEAMSGRKFLKRQVLMLDVSKEK